ncbi:MAG TPA: hypothetical protein VFT49_03980 [Candidatus Saccharimonadales bacterium]|nr:hypothetical protein [Candidatus Saccharimonadales bacterium]
MERKIQIRDWAAELKRAEESGDDDEYYGLILQAQQTGLPEEEILNLINVDNRKISDLDLADDPAWQRLIEKEE